MKIVNRKTRKAIRKSVNKVLKKHGPEFAAGLAGSVASALATLASTQAPGRGKKSNLAAMSERVSDRLTGDGSSASVTKGRSAKKAHKKRVKLEKKQAHEEQLDGSV